MFAGLVALASLTAFLGGLSDSFLFLFSFFDLFGEVSSES